MNTDELSRDDLLALLADIGGYGGDLQAVSDDALHAVLRNRLALVVDLSRIDAALKRLLPMEWRGILIGRRIEIENAARAVREAASRRSPRVGNLVVTIPVNLGVSHFEGHDGRVAMSRVEGGRAVLDLFIGEFRILLKGPQGLDWQNANPDIIRDAA